MALICQIHREWAHARPVIDITLARFPTRYPVVWRGNLALKDAQATVMMYFLSGNIKFARTVLPQDEADPTPLRITEERRLVPEALNEVIQNIKILFETPDIAANISD
ncbi:SPOC domain-containing protein [Trichonephila inaurata madagascariensis]|uniref:SPOC domain-containing protein n=1 Tax=Trichonephila inaurata madagascariensis TaxID=2747483 RepID=A0A8X7C117_9ARAC|nr:SPOC domain-containing protein [Trichonephila inaurata madagascariensis]